MKYLDHRTSLLLALVLVGCGGSATDPADPLGGSLIDLSPGSQQLVFTDVVDPDISSHGSDSLDHPYRLDLRRDGDDWSAVLTRRWGVPLPYAVQVEQTEARLTGSGSPTAYDYGRGTDKWQSLVLQGGGDGKLVSFTATGIQEAWFGDYTLTGDLSGSGTISADTIAPELEGQPETLFAGPEGLLPWDGVRVRAAEGIAEAELVDALSVTHAGGAVSVDWELSPDDPATRWPGAVGAIGGWPWLELADGADLTLRAEGYQDPSGNAGTAYELPITVLGLPPAQSSFSFDSDPSMRSWGSATWLDGSSECEQGSCMRIGPYDVSPCDAHLAGVAGRLSAPSASAVRVRHRVVLHDDPESFWEVVGKVWLLSVDGATREQEISISGQDLTPVGSDWTTPWIDLDVDATAVTGEVMGMAIHAGGDLSGCGAGYPVPFSSATLYIDAIELSP